MTTRQDRPSVTDRHKPIQEQSPQGDSAYADLDLDQIADLLLDGTDRLEWAVADRPRRLAMIAEAAGRQGDLSTYRWAQRERLEDPRAGCPHKIPQQREVPGGMEFRFLDCGRRVCDWCGPLHVLARAEELRQGFEQLGITAHTARLIYGTRAEATNRTTWLTRHGHAAVTIAQADGQAVIVTSADQTPAAWPVLSLDEIYCSLREGLERLLEGVPAEERTRVRPNALLREAIQQAAEQPHDEDSERETRPEPADAEPWESSRHAVASYAIAHRLVTGWSSDGTPRLAALPEDAPHHGTIMAALRSATPPVGRSLRTPVPA
jgi:hypothetical protein